jgi:hypothetical protein
MLTQALVALLAAKLLAGPVIPTPAPASDERGASQGYTVIVDQTTCVALDRREMHNRFHAFVCADTAYTGDVTGAVLNPNGRVMCDLDGQYDGACVYLVGCGISGYYC